MKGPGSFPELALAAVLLAGAAAGAGAEVSGPVLGGRLALGARLEAAEEGEGVQGGLRASFSPLAYLGGEAGSLAWELRAEGLAEAATRPLDAAVSLASASARFWAGEHLWFEAAYGLDESLAAEVFTLTAFLGPADPLARLEDWEAEPRRAEPFLRIGMFQGSGRASLLLAPFKPPLALADLESPFFPAKAAPESFGIEGYRVWRRDRLYYYGGDLPSGELEGKASWEWAPSWKAKVGASLGSWDLDALWFHGLERQASLYPRLSFPGGLGEDGFELGLEPRRADTDVLALAATLIAGPARYWAEASYAWGTSFETGSAYSAELSGASSLGDYLYQVGGVFFSSVPPILQLDRIALTAGASYRPDWNRIVATLLAEATYAWYLGAPEGRDYPALSRAAAASVSLSDPAERFSGGLAWVLSLADGSGLLRPSLGFSLVGELGLELAALFFLGSEDSELGQHAAQARLEATLRFRL